MSWRQALSLASLGGPALLWSNLALRVIQGILPLLGLVAMQQFLDAVAIGISARNTGGAVDPDAWSAVVMAVVFAASVALGGALLTALASVLGERHSRRVVDRCAERLQRHAGNLDLLQIENPQVGNLLHRASSEVSQRPVRVVQNLVALLLALVSLAVMAATVAWLSLWLALSVAALSVPQVVVRMRHARRQFDWQQHRTPALRRLAYLGGLLVGRHMAKDLRATGLAEPVAGDVGQLRRQLTDEQIALQQRRVVGETTAQLLATAAVFGGYLYLGHLGLAGALSIGTLLLQAQALQRLQNAMRDSMLAYGGMREDRLFLQQFFAFLAVEPTVVAPAHPVGQPVLQPATAASGNHELRCQAITFAYPNARGSGTAQPVLNDLDLIARPGERIGILGHNGAGKSTLVRLLCRLCDPDAGAITFGAVPLVDMDPLQWRKRIAVFFQDAARLELSARHNLDYCATDADDERLLAVADRLGIGAWLRALPNQLATPLGRTFEGSVEASIGQWRKLLLARTLARESDIVLLDEPFAFLDSDGQRALSQALEQIGGQRTILVVEHRIEHLRGFDRLVQLDHGRLVEIESPSR